MKRHGVWLMAMFGLVAASLSASDRDWIPGITVEHDLPLKLRDGVTLYADVYRPAKEGRYPALLMRTPYDKSSEPTQSGRLPLTVAAVRRGYVVVAQDVRGQFRSEGFFTPYAQEINDGYDTIEWVAGLPYVNGKVGTFGLSYPGAVQWMAAPTRPPHLVAMAPSMTFASGRHFFYYGGIFDAQFVEWLLGRQIPERRRLGMPLVSEEEIDAAFEKEGDGWQRFVPLGDLPLMSPFKYWKEWIDNPIESAYWKPYDIEAQHHLVQVPALNFTGWNDDAYGQPGAIRNFMGMLKNGGSEAARKGQRLIIGPWVHGVPDLDNTTYDGVDFGPNAVIDYNEPQLRFFDYWMKGIDDGYSNEAPIRIFVMGDNVWRDEREWPPARTEYKSLFLRADRQMASAAPAREQPDTFVYDPHSPVRLPPFTSKGQDWTLVTSRPDVLTYTTEPLERATEVTGQILAKLWISSTAPDTDFTMKVLDVNQSGVMRRLTSEPGTLRARYRNMEDLAAPAPLPRGQAVELTLSLGYTSYVVAAGHRLRVFVTSSTIPNVHPNTWEPFTSWSQAISATQTIYHDDAHPSRVILPTIPR